MTYYVGINNVISGKRCFGWHDKQQVLDWCSAEMGRFRYTRHREIHESQILGLCKWHSPCFFTSNILFLRCQILWVYILRQPGSWLVWIWPITFGLHMETGSRAWSHSLNKPWPKLWKPTQLVMSCANVSGRACNSIHRNRQSHTWIARFGLAYK